jgi:hypothetical protein
MKDLARSLAEIELLDADERPVKLGEAWSERPALIVFIRHFG